MTSHGQHQQLLVRFRLIYCMSFVPSLCCLIKSTLSIKEKLSVSLPTKGDPASSGNWRPITLTNTDAMNTRIADVGKKISNKYQTVSYVVDSLQFADNGVGVKLGMVHANYCPSDATGYHWTSRKRTIVFIQHTLNNVLLVGVSHL